MPTSRKRFSALSPVTDAPLASDAPVRPRQRTKVPLPANVERVEPQPPRRQPSRASSTHASTITNANSDAIHGHAALSPLSNAVLPPGVGLDLKPRREKHVGPAPAATGAEPNARTEEISIDVPAGARVRKGSGRARRLPPPGSPGNANEPGLSSETAPAHVPEQQPGRIKRKRPVPQHVKVDDAAVVSASATTTSAASSNVSATAAVERDVGVTLVDPEANEGPVDGMDGEDEAREALSRPPPVNSDYLPLPWKGRLGYACLNTYLRNASPPVFSSRTCRIASIIEHRHPLKDPSQPEHATKNRPDRDQPADVARGQRYVEEIGLANARDIIKMLRWNDRYGIKFMRLSSEMFPFASHDEYGYKLAPFAADTLAEAGRVVAELGHRVTTHPGQFTQLGSPRKQVIDNAIRDLVYHDEMLSLLKLPPQQDRDAVMIMHLGGAFGDKAATLDRFRENYARLPQSVKNRLVLENDDVVWSVHELLPLCQELNIPFVLDFHHHNIVFDSKQIREGTKDIVDLIPAIVETWSKKGITPKMHYSEPCPDAVTARSRRKHSPRVMTLPPCPNTMDLMIEAKDKEQAVFELMRTFKLPGFDLFNNVTPHVRQDENRPWKPKAKKVAKRGRRKDVDGMDLVEAKLEEEEEKPPPMVAEEDVAMGGPERRVYWPPGMEDWLRPPKRIVKSKEDAKGGAAPAQKKRKVAGASTANSDGVASINGKVANEGRVDTRIAIKKAMGKRGTTGSARKRGMGKAAPTPEPSDEESDPLASLGEDEDSADGGSTGGASPSQSAAAPRPTRKRSGRVSQRINYKEEEADEVSV